MGLISIGATKLPDGTDNDAIDLIGRWNRSWRLFTTLSGRRPSLRGSWPGGQIMIWMIIWLWFWWSYDYDLDNHYKDDEMSCWSIMTLGPGVLLLPRPGLHWGTPFVPGWVLRWSLLLFQPVYTKLIIIHLLQKAHEIVKDVVKCCSQFEFWNLLQLHNFYFTLGWIRVPKNLLASWHCQPESFCASGKFLRVFTKLPIKCSLNINWTEE